MVVDDDRVARLVVQHRLALLGVTAFSVGNCADALSQAALRRPAVVLLDTCLPDGDGYRLATQLTRQFTDASLATPSLISLSARTGEAHRRCCLDAGIESLLPKPASLAQLARALGVATAGDAVRNTALDMRPALAVGKGADDLIALYHRACREDLAGLKRAVTCRDADRARAFAHRLRGASAWVGDGVVSAIAAIFEPPEGARAAEPFIQDAAVRWLDGIFNGGSLPSFLQAHHDHANG